MRNTKLELRPLCRYGLLIAIAVFSSLLVTKNIDFRVYWYGARGFFDGSLPAYGPRSGLGFPMHYRYPPVTYIFLWPLTRISLYWGGVLWMMGAWTAAAATVLIAIRAAHLRFHLRSVLVACAFMLSYVVLSLRSGNIQTYIIAMIFGALLLSESHQRLAGSLMAMAITFKVWPVFFLPWFLRRERRSVLAWLTFALLLLWSLPFPLLGPSRYIELIHDWYWSEFHTATTNSEIWYFPGQSLRGVLLRYCAELPPWIDGFPDVHLLSLPALTVVRIWEAIAAVGYLGVCTAMLRSSPEKPRVGDGVSFAALSILQPFCLKSSMISLGPAALIAAALYSPGCRGVGEGERVLPRCMFLAACVLSFLSATLQYKPLSFLLLAWGVDFYAALLLLVSLLLWLRPPAGTAGQMRGNTLRSWLARCGSGLCPRLSASSAAGEDRIE